MILLVIIGIQTLETLLLLITPGTKEKIVTILTHPTVLYNVHLACKTLVLLLVVQLRLEYHLHLVLCLVVTGIRVCFWTLEITFLAWVREKIT
jgi:hypothetical protein